MVVDDDWGWIRGFNLAEFLKFRHQPFLKWLPEEPLVSPTASGICLKMFLILCSFHHKTQCHVGHSER